MATVSEIEICNMALAAIRAKSINSLTEASLQAQQCNLWYPNTRDMVLRDILWPWAHKVDALALVTDDLFNWVYAYQYPADCLKIDRLILNYEAFSSSTSGAVRPRHIEDIYLPDLDAQVKYEVFNVNDKKVIGANESQLRVSYHKAVVNPQLFDPVFVQALVYLLAANLAIPIVGAENGRQLRSDNLSLYGRYIAAAAADAKNEKYTPPVESDFITIRR